MNQTGIQSTTQRNGIRYDNGEILELLDLKYESRLVYSGQLSGEQLFNNDRTKINWMMGYSHTNKNQPDNRRLEPTCGVGVDASGAFVEHDDVRVA